MKVKATSAGTPPLPSADAFARLLVASMQQKRPDLQLVKRAADEESRQQNAQRNRG